MCCLGAIGSLLGLVATIAFHQQRPLPQWPYSLTINSVISLFILLHKTCSVVILSQGLSQLKWSWFMVSRPLRDIAIYDEASRGSWGAARLPWLLKHRQIVASLAGCIMIVALALDPLALQLVRYYSCQRPAAPLRGAFPRTQIFGETGSHTEPGKTTTPLGIVAAVQAGVFADVMPLIPWDCPTKRSSCKG